MSDALRTLSLAYRLARERFGRPGSRRRTRNDRRLARGPRGRLFRKYVVLFVALVSFVLLVNAALHFWFSYNENKTAAFRIQQEKAGSAARRIEEFVDEIERQLAGRRRRNGRPVRSNSAASIISGCCAKCRRSRS